MTTVGEELPVLAVEMTATRIVAGALATRDFMPVHHDRDYANKQGAPDIFMNILSSTAFCSRYLTDWAGPEARLERIAIRLGVPVHPDTTLTFSGKVTGVDALEDEERLGVEFRATTATGDHVTGTATLTVPAGAR